MSYSEREELFIERLLSEGWIPPAPKSKKPWFSNPTEAIRWLRDDARQFHDDNPEVAAHLFECASMWEKERKERAK